MQPVTAAISSIKGKRIFMVSAVLYAASGLQQQYVNPVRLHHLHLL